MMQDNPDGDLAEERIRLLVRADDYERQIRDLTAARANVTARLDEMASELRGRRFAREQVARAAAAEAAETDEA